MKKINIQKLKAIALLIFCILFYSSAWTQVGVKTNDPNTSLDINGSSSLKEGQVLILSNNNNNNIDLGTKPYSYYTISGPTASFNITGVVPLNGSDGQILVLQNNTDQIMTILDNDNLSQLANRIILPNRKDFMVRGKYASITLQYRANVLNNRGRWFLINGLNNVQTWYTQGLVILIDGTRTTITITAPSITITSGITVSLVNNSGLPDAEKYNLIVEYVEARNGSFIFRVNNKNPQQGWPPWIYTGVEVQYAFTYFIN